MKSHIFGKNARFGLSVSTIAVALLAGIQPAMAQSESADVVEEEAFEGGEGDVIVVTAQKRSEDVQDVPISIVALGSEKLAQANILNVQDLPRLATNFTATRSGQIAGLRLAVRGIGAPGNTATEPSVAAFVDGIYVPRPGSVIGSFLDIDGVEILRGPQGTLFGRNASVGALSFRTAQPRDEFSGQIGAEIGNGDRYKLSGHVNVPLSENVAVRFAGQGSWLGGYWHNRLDGKTYGKA